MTLGLAAGAAVVHLLHTAESDEGEVLEVSESVWPADRVVILDEYAVPGAADVESTGSEI
jgi:DNA-binding GntR family transcriptional regulator